MPARTAWRLAALTIVAACLGLVVACGGAPASKPRAEIKTNFHAPPEPVILPICPTTDLIEPRNSSLSSFP